MIEKLVGRHAKLRVPASLWRDMTIELARRGAGRRESGAFLLAPVDRRRRAATRIGYFDDLDATCLTGGISMSGSAFNRLWDICENERLRVIADVHTHPGTSVRQSGTDQDNPMIAQAGHIAVIMPNFGTGSPSAELVGVHEYLGGAGWSEHLGTAARRALYVGRWA